MSLTKTQRRSMVRHEIIHAAIARTSLADAITTGLAIVSPATITRATLSDGSQTFMVHVDQGAFDATSERDAQALADKICAAITEHTSARAIPQYTY